VEVGRLELWPASQSAGWSKPRRSVRLRFSEPVATAPARCAPLPTDMACTQRVPITAGSSGRDDALPPLLGPSCLPGELVDQLVHRVP
jgi:hypothetical protein